MSIRHTMNAEPVPETAPDISMTAFAFVQELAAELSKGKVDLPSLPDVAIRVRNVLADEDSTLDQVVRVAGSDPVLAASLLRMANSAALNTSGRPITELRTAINRIGYNIVRSAAISLAMSQLRTSEGLRAVRPQLEALWEESTHVAAIAFVLAKRFTARNADEALVTGLLYNVGKIYITARMAQHPELFGDAENEQAIMRDWHANIGAAILENWGLPEEVCEAVRDHEDIARTHRGVADLTDVVTVSVILAQTVSQPSTQPPNFLDLKPFRMLGLDDSKHQTVMQEMEVEVRALRQTLNGN